MQSASTIMMKWNKHLLHGYKDMQSNMWNKNGGSWKQLELKRKAECKSR